MASRPKRKAPCDLEEFRSQIEELYCVKKYSVKRICSEINSRYGLDTTHHPYKNKISDWGLQKNLKRSQVVAAKHQLEQRKGKSSEGVVPGNTAAGSIIISHGHLERSIRRYDQSIGVLEKFKQEATERQLSSLQRDFVPVEHSITVYTPPTEINQILDHSSHLNTAVLKTLPIFVAADTLANLFHQFFRRTAQGSKFTELSTIQGLPHFALIRHIVFQTSNNLMDYPQIYKLLDKIAEMRCWEPFCAILSKHSVTIRACGEKILPLLLFKGEIKIFNIITKAQNFPAVSLYSLFKEGENIVAGLRGFRKHGIQYNRTLKDFHKFLLDGIMEEEIPPPNRVAAFRALKAARDFAIPFEKLLRLFKVWQIKASDMEDIANICFRFLEEPSRNEEAEMLSVHLRDNRWSPVLDDTPRDLQPLLKFGFRKGIYNKLLRALCLDDRLSVVFLLDHLELRSEIQSRVDLVDNPEHISKHFSRELINEVFSRCLDEFEDGEVYGRVRRIRELLSLGNLRKRICVFLLHATENLLGARWVWRQLQSGHPYPLSRAELGGTIKLACELNHIAKGYRDDDEVSKLLISKIRLILEMEISDPGLLLIPIDDLSWLYSEVLMPRKDNLMDSSGLEFQPDLKIFTQLLDLKADPNSPIPHTKSSDLSWPLIDIATAEPPRIIDLALLADEPDLFCLLIKAGANTDLMAAMQLSQSGLLVLSSSLVHAMKQCDFEAILHEWNNRFERNMKSPYDTLSDALKRQDDPKLHQALALKYLEERNHPLIKCLSEFYESNGANIHCPPLLIWFIGHLFEQCSQDSTTLVPSQACIKLIHCEAAKIVYQNNDTKILSMLVNYGLQAESLEYDEKHYLGAGLPTPWSRQSTFLNIPISTIQLYSKISAECFSLLLDLGFDINDSGSSSPYDPYKDNALTYAIRGGDLKWIVFLLKKGASIYCKRLIVDLENLSLPEEEMRTTTAVEIAVHTGRIDIVALFLRFDPGCRDMALKQALLDGKPTMIDMIQDWRPEDVDLLTTWDSIEFET